MISPLQVKKLRSAEVKQCAKGQVTVRTRTGMPNIVTMLLGLPPSPDSGPCCRGDQDPPSLIPASFMAPTHIFWQMDQNPAFYLFQLPALRREWIC